MKQESIEYLQELMTEINRQDNRCTASPYYYVIQVQELVEDCDGEEHYFLEGEEITKEELVKLTTQELEDNYGEGATVESVLEEKCSALYMSLKWVDTCDNNGIFLTEKAANEHIKLNGYHYNNPRTYVRYFWRCPEIEKLFEAISDVCGVKWEKH